jgi:hypothetical protein
MNDEVERDEFSVYVFRPDGTYWRELSFVSAERAVTWAKWLTEERAARHGETAKIIITDGGDFTVFEWRFGEGVVHPPLSTEG